MTRIPPDESKKWLQRANPFALWMGRFMLRGKAKPRCLASRQGASRRPTGFECTDVRTRPLTLPYQGKTVLDGEIVCLDKRGRPQFRDLLFHRGEPCFYAFDLLYKFAGKCQVLANTCRRINRGPELRAENFSPSIPDSGVRRA